MGSWLQPLVEPRDALLVVYGLGIVAYAVLGTVLALRGRRSARPRVDTRDRPRTGP